MTHFTFDVNVPLFEVRLYPKIPILPKALKIRLHPALIKTFTPKTFSVYLSALYAVCR